MFEEPPLANPPPDNGDASVEEGGAIENPSLQDDVSIQDDIATEGTDQGAVFIENPTSGMEVAVSDEEASLENPPP